MFLQKSLTKLGLTDKQSAIYLACLELGTDTVQNIAKKAEIKRSTAYIILEELKQKGLISEQPSYSGNRYTAENPDKFKVMLEIQKNELAYAFPFLKGMYNQEKSKPQVKVYEGINGIKNVYSEYIFKSKTPILFFSAIVAIIKKMPDMVNLWLNEAKNNPNLSSMEILNPTAGDIKYGQRQSNTNKNCQIRILPKKSEYLFQNTDNAIFEDKIMLVSLKDKLFTTLIQSEILANSMRALFNLAWQSAIPLDKFVKNKIKH